jgi:hypothetical protein
MVSHEVPAVKGEGANPAIFISRRDASSHQHPIQDRHADGRLALLAVKPRARSRGLINAL